MMKNQTTHTIKAFHDQFGQGISLCNFWQPAVDNDAPDNPT